MKQLAIVTAALVALTGCSTTMGDKMSTPTMSDTMMHNHNKVTYACSGHADTHVHAEYSPNSDIATLSITAHSLGLNHQKVMLKQAVSASGDRYVNDLNPHSTYEWHTKGNYGVLTITTPTGEYQRNCEVSSEHAVH